MITLPLHYPGLTPLGNWIGTVWVAGTLPSAFAFMVVVHSWVLDTGRDWDKIRYAWLCVVCALLWPPMLAIGLVYDIALSALWPFRRRRALLAQRAWLLDAAESYEHQAEQLDGHEDAHAATCRHAASQFRLAGRGHRPTKERTSV